MSNILIKKADDEDIGKILPFLAEFRLDSENIISHQFVIAEMNGELAGFGRIKPYERIMELSSLGVIKEYRSRGIGEKIVKSLIDTCPSPEIWITTKIPDFFRKFGFEETKNPPDEIMQKCQRVCGNASGSVEDSYYMLYKK